MIKSKKGFLIKVDITIGATSTAQQWEEAIPINWKIYQHEREISSWQHLRVSGWAQIEARVKVEDQLEEREQEVKGKGAGDEGNALTYNSHQAEYQYVTSTILFLLLPISLSLSCKHPILLTKISPAVLITVLLVY